MRIVGGVHRGRRLVAPKGQSTRPTADRTREAIFNILEHAAWSPAIAGLTVIDLFAGSGALGLEALSRGAASCLFVDSDAGAGAAIGENALALKLEAQARVDRRDVRRGWVCAGRLDGPAADLALLDPPCGRGSSSARARRAGKRRMAGAGRHRGGRARRGRRGLTAPGFRVLDTRTVGRSQVSFLRAGGDGGGAE